MHVNVMMAAFNVSSWCVARDKEYVLPPTNS